MGVHSHPQGEAGQSSAFADLGPVLRPAGEMRAIANEAYQLVLILQHALRGGEHLRADTTLKKLAALVGPPPESGDYLEQGPALQLGTE